MITKEEAVLLTEATEMFNEVPAEKIVPDAKEYILEAIDDAKAIYDPEIWDSFGFALVLFWLTQKWQQKCRSLAHGRSAKPDPACLDSAAAELIREIIQQPPLN